MAPCPGRWPWRSPAWQWRWRPPWRSGSGPDTVVLVTLSFGLALAAYVVGRSLLRRSRSPVVVALIPAAAMALGPAGGGLGDVRVQPRPVRPRGRRGQRRHRRAARRPGARHRARSGPPPGGGDDRSGAGRLEQSRRELVAWVSHDLRTPLAGIRAHGRGARRRHRRRARRGPPLPPPAGDRGRPAGPPGRRPVRAVPDPGRRPALSLERVPLSELVSDAVASAAVGGRSQGRRHRAAVRPGARTRGGGIAARADAGGAQPARQRHPPHAGGRDRGGRRQHGRRRRRGLGARRLRRHPRPPTSTVSSTSPTGATAPARPEPPAAPGWAWPSPAAWWRPTGATSPCATSRAAAGSPCGCRWPEWHRRPEPERGRGPLGAGDDVADVPQPAAAHHLGLEPGAGAHRPGQVEHRAGRAGGDVVRAPATGSGRVRAATLARATSWTWTKSRVCPPSS